MHKEWLLSIEELHRYLPTLLAMNISELARFRNGFISKTPKTWIHLPIDFSRFSVDPPGEKVDFHYEATFKFCLVSLTKENTKI